MEQTNDLLSKAIVKVRQKHNLTFKTSPGITPPQASHELLYPMLEVWDKAREDRDIQQRAQFIWGYLTSRSSNPKDLLLQIVTQIGATPMGEAKIDRIYRYCRLKSHSARVLQEYENLQGEINALSTKEAV